MKQGIILFFVLMLSIAANGIESENSKDEVCQREQLNPKNTCFIQ